MSNAYAREVTYGRQIFQGEKTDKCSSGNTTCIETGFGDTAKPQLIPIKSLSCSPL